MLFQRVTCGEEMLEAWRDKHLSHIICRRYCRENGDGAFPGLVPSAATGLAIPLQRPNRPVVAILNCGRRWQSPGLVFFLCQV